MVTHGSREKKKAKRATSKTGVRARPRPTIGDDTALPSVAVAGAGGTKPPAKPGRVKVPFPRKNQPPSETEFAARLPVAVGKKFEAVRSYLKKQKGVVEDLYFYGPKTGWAFRYLRGKQSLATVMIHDDRLMGILALDSVALETVDFPSLSDVGQHARRVAHGTPSLLWLDLPLDGTGASDFKALLKAKVKASRPAGPPPPPSRPAPPSPPRSPTR